MKIKLIVVTALMSGLIWQSEKAHAQILTNGSFENDASEISTGKVNSGFDATTVDNGPKEGQAVNISGWENIGGVAPTDSGVQYASPAVGSGGVVPNNTESGTYFAFQKAGDGLGAYQITDTTLNVGDQLTLTWYAGISFNFPTQTVHLLTADSLDASYASSTVLTPTTSSDLTLTNAYKEYTLTYTVTAADAGKFVGVSFSTGGGTNTYAQYDNFVLTDIPAEVPEPSTYALLFAGLVGLVLMQRLRRPVLI